jgi:hypothetical protein
MSTDIWQAMNSDEVGTTIGIYLWFEISEWWVGRDAEGCDVGLVKGRPAVEIWLEGLEKVVKGSDKVAEGIRTRDFPNTKNQMTMFSLYF